jgi:hypothetical protein
MVRSVTKQRLTNAQQTGTLGVCFSGCKKRETGWGGMDWIHLAQGRDQWRALVNTVMSLRVP